MKAYVTKWWETRGIAESDGGKFDEDGRWYCGPGTRGLSIKWGRDAFATRQEAESAVRLRALKRAVALRKQLEYVDAIASGKETP